MQLIQRIKKMENRITKEDSEFCDCEKEVKFKIITCPEDDTQTPDTCEVCSKPNREPLRFTFDFQNNLRINHEHSKQIEKT
jgi:hypothetical protein